MHVVATAGHVDHGKSTLVQALTGTDPDRWAEEKTRGLTIDLGFAFTTLPSGAGISFVDVPGHVRFLKNMLAGVGAVDACLFVVAATEGWKPQSEEHLRILELLGIGRGLVALTKVGLVDEDLADLAAAEVADHVEGTFLAGAEVIGVDAPTGVGLDALRAGLDRLLAATPTAVDHDRPRLWVDRAFAARGAGTVVTGTLGGGALAVDDELVVLPAGHRVRVRGLQSAGTAHDRLGPGHRVAANLVGVHHEQVVRGDVVVRAGQWHRTARVDASLTVLGALDHPVSRRGAHVAYLGSGEHPVRVRVLGPDALAPGETGLVRLHLPRALPLLPGDRYLLRESGRQETVGGGEILDVDPVVAAARARPDRSVDRVVRERGWTDADELARLTGVRRAPTVGRWVVDPDQLAARRTALLDAVTAAGDRGLELATVDERQRAVADLLAAEGEVVIDRGRATRGAPPDAWATHPYLAAVDATPFAPPTPDEAGADRAEVRELVRRGLLVEKDGCWFTPVGLDAAAAVIAGLLADDPTGVTVSQVREALGSTRKYVLPLLAVLDGTGRTRRRGDRRIAGPRLLDGSGPPSVSPGA